jgi:probable HAF family extracellular repeat protein
MCEAAPIMMITRPAGAQRRQHEKRGQTMIRKVALGLFATIVLAVSAPAQSYYEVQNIGVLSGQTSSTALDINNKGVVVGRSGNRAFIYQDCMLGDIGTLGGSSASAEAISKDGTIVGVSTRSDGKKRAFMRQGGIMWDLGGASNFEESAFAISSWNLPVGIESVSGLAATAVWYFNNRTIALPQILVNPPSGFANVQHVTDVNDSLQVTGFLDNPQIGVVSAPGFGQWTRIQGIPGFGSAVKPLAINNNGCRRGRRRAGTARVPFNRSEPACKGPGDARRSNTGQCGDGYQHQWLGGWIVRKLREKRVPHISSQRNHND